MICVDTNVLAWGIRGDPITPSDVERGMVARAQTFFTSLDPARERVLVPAPVLAELLVPIADDQAKRTAVLRAIEETMMVGQLDHVASIFAAQITHRNGPASRASGTTSTRQELRVDALILGIALARGCRMIVTNDLPGMTALAKEFRIEVRDLPPLSDADRQRGLFVPPAPGAPSLGG